MPSALYYRKHAEKYKKMAREFAIKNRDYVSKRMAKWRVKNRKRVAAYNKYHYWKNRPWHLERWREWAKGKHNLNYERMHLPKYRWTAAKNTAKRRMLEWCIPLSEYLEFLRKPCYYCDGRLSQIGCGLDRVDNSKGYLISNVVPACGPCNKMRGNYVTSDEMRVAMQAVKELRLKKALQGVI